jgi:hypothetical protein
VDHGAIGSRDAVDWIVRADTIAAPALTTRAATGTHGTT